MPFKEKLENATSLVLVIVFFLLLYFSTVSTNKHHQVVVDLHQSCGHVSNWFIPKDQFLSDEKRL